MTTTNDKNIATVLHLSALTQYIIPLGSFIFPIVIWSSKKESAYVDFSGKQVLNFQLSILLYTIVLCLIAIPIVLYNIPFEAIINGDDFTIRNFHFGELSGIAAIGITTGFIFGVLKVAEFALIILGAVKASNGENYKYPLSIPFFK